MEQTIEPRYAGIGGESSTSPGKSAASWPAIFAGAFVAASVTVIMFALGSGLGFASVSPWPNHGVSAATFTATMAIWLIVTQWISAGFGGYIAGRLRTKWVGTHTHEVFFRDTAHGLVTWAVATVVLTGIVATSVFSAIGGGVHAVADAVPAGIQGAAAAQGAPGPQGAMPAPYVLDKLFRSQGGTSGAQSTGDPRVEASHIVANAFATGAVPDADRTYLTELVAARSGVSQADAQKRVDDFVAATMEAQSKLKATADAARKAAAQASIYTALSMLVGAFIACVSAALGGRLRDEHL